MMRRVTGILLSALVACTAVLPASAQAGRGMVVPMQGSFLEQLQPRDSVLIADQVHLHKTALRLCYNAKGYEHCILITDSIAATCIGDGHYKLGGLDIIVKNGEARLPEGNLAGSTLTMERAVKNMIEAVHVPVEHVLQMASRIPLESIGITDRGVIGVGKKAEMVLLNGDWSVKRTIVNGITAFEA